MTGGAEVWDLAAGPEFLVHTTITGGIGMAGIGIDRGEIGPSLLCRADRRGHSVIVTAHNVAFGHSGDTDAARAAAARSFAESALARCPSPTQDTFDPRPLGLVDHLGAGRVLTDATETPYVLDHDLSGVERVAWYGPILAIEAVLAFRPDRVPPKPPPVTGHSPRSPRHRDRRHPAPADAVSVRQQVTLRPLPETMLPEPKPEPEPMAPLPLDPTIGAMPHLTMHRFDEIDRRDAETALATRFRSPGTASPIVFHLDPAMPAPVRDTVLEGGNWWQEAFAGAGLPGAYRVEVLPEGADLSDPRLNVVLWVHRADRGWSFGLTQLDPRTGEILRGVVVLGSQRVEQLRAITESVLAPYDAGTSAEVTADAVGAVAAVGAVVAARMRQLAAHEIGHALGLAHNFASHLHADPSVMDYPGPAFGLDEHARPTAAHPYVTGLGKWDLRQVAALYGTAAPDPDWPTLYITDADARLDEAADACGGTWIAPGDPVERLCEIVDVRAAALARFGPSAAPPGSDSNEIERRFVLLYLLHRHQATAVAKLVGGLRRHYARTDGTRFDGAATPVPADEQAAAVQSLAALLTPEFLAIPAHVRPLLVGPSGGRPRRDGQFDHRTAGAFDEAGAVTAGADLVAGLLLAPARLNRVVSRSVAVAGTAFSLPNLIAATVGRAVALLDGPSAGRTECTEVIGWTVLRRFECALESPQLHHHARVAAVEAAAAEPFVVAGLGRPALRTRWASIERAAFEHPAKLPPLPPGTPI